MINFRGKFLSPYIFENYSFVKCAILFILFRSTTYKINVPLDVFVAVLSYFPNNSPGMQAAFN